MTSRVLIRFLAAGCAAAAISACQDGPSDPGVVGPPAKLARLAAGTPSGFANTAITTPIEIQVQDANNKPVSGQTVEFAVVDGDGSLAATSDVSDANGVVTVPTWTLGKSAAPQRVRASMGTITLNVDATVTTSYNIVVRFFGAAMTPAQQALFSNAAARLKGIVTGDVIDAQASNFDIATPCQMPGQAPLNELIDDIIIYASIDDIDGQGKILAQAGPCLYRDLTPNSAKSTLMPAVGKMQFDKADINQLAGSGSLQEVITHEMLHVLGVGVLWDADNRDLIVGSGTADPRYRGSQGIAGCIAVGGTTTCASTVPLESGGGAGTAESHWRESTFDSELMTGFIDTSPNPLSQLTIGALADLGYVVNNADFDIYRIPGGAFRAGTAGIVAHRENWERGISGDYVYVLQPGGGVKRLPRVPRR